MGRKPSGKPVGRPEVPIDWKHFEQLCFIQCTHDEIASFCKINRETLYIRAEKQYGEDFPTIYKRFSDGGRMSLRRHQYRIAEKNTAMAIWLGKQYLGQREPESNDRKYSQEQKEGFDEIAKAIQKAIESK